MPCLEMHDGNNQVIGHVCRPDGERKPVEGRRRKRWWCFNCRKHFLHTYMGFYPPEMSYYGPHFWWECPQCHQEHVLFPGREWVYED